MNSWPGRRSELHAAAYASLRRPQQGLDIVAGQIELLPFMHQISVDSGNAVLDAHLLSTQYELLKFAMRRNQGDRGRRFERHATFGAKYRVAKMNAASDSISCRQALPVFRSVRPAPGLCHPARPGRRFKRERMV